MSVVVVTAVCNQLFLQVVLMLWNSSLPWASSQFQFVELFSGRGHASKEWSGAHV
jgi:hypothetical protein